jgi:hypothetical protein
VAVPLPGAQAVAPALSERGARVQIAANRLDLWLELRAFGETGAWNRACPAPCGRWLATDGFEARLVAPGMTPSHPFRLLPGAGTAQLSVQPGSSAARALGRASWITGIPLALVGMFALGYGSYHDAAGLRSAGALALGGGAALILVSLPLLVLGSTEVHDAEGTLIAKQTQPPPL